MRPVVYIKKKQKLLKSRFTRDLDQGFSKGPRDIYRGATSRSLVLSLHLTFESKMKQSYAVSK